MDCELAHTGLATSWHHFTWPPPQHQATQQATGEFELFTNFYDFWQAVTEDWDDIIPVTPCHWDEIIDAVDGGQLPDKGEALDESIGINEAVYSTTQLQGGFHPHINKSTL